MRSRRKNDEMGQLCPPKLPKNFNLDDPNEFGWIWWSTCLTWSGQQARCGQGGYDSQGVLGGQVDRGKSKGQGVLDSLKASFFFFFIEVTVCPKLPKNILTSTTPHGYGWIWNDFYAKKILTSTTLEFLEIL